MFAQPSFRRAYPADARLSSWRAGDGWQLRRFDWPAASAARGSVLFAGGRGDVIEKYLEYFAHLHARGWHVSAFDWRGQGGSGRLSGNARVGHADSFGPWLEDVEHFWAGWVKEAPGPHIAIGHSMGGHLILRAMLDGVMNPRAAVLVAPMMGLRSPLGARWGERMAALMAMVGDPARAAWKDKEHPTAISTRQKLLTHDRTRYADEAWWRGEKPELELGPPSWAWVREAFRSTAAVAIDPRLEDLRTPIQMLVAEADGLVDSGAALRIAARLPAAELVRFGPEAAHELLREADPVRDRAIAAIDAFLDRHAA